MKINTNKKSNLILDTHQQKGEIELDLSQLRQSILVLRALNHKIRQEILKLISFKKEATVSEIHFNLNLKQSFASQQLALLRSANVLVTNRQGKFTYYMLNVKKLKKITFYISKLLV